MSDLESRLLFTAVCGILVYIALILKWLERRIKQLEKRGLTPTTHARQEDEG